MGKNWQRVDEMEDTDGEIVDDGFEVQGHESGVDRDETEEVSWVDVHEM